MSWAVAERACHVPSVLDGYRFDWFVSESILVVCGQGVRINDEWNLIETGGEPMLLSPLSFGFSRVIQRNALTNA